MVKIFKLHQLTEMKELKKTKKTKKQILFVPVMLHLQSFGGKTPDTVYAHVRI